MELTRRQWLQGTAAGLAGLPLGAASLSLAATDDPRGETLLQVADKVPLKVVIDKPLCLETPWRHFEHDFTPNDAFFIRWHANVPAPANLKTWRLRIDGAVERPLELSMDDLLRLGSDEVAAVNQCSGNSRIFVSPRTPGAQWQNGAMGNARWAGVGLARVLRAAGVKREAVQVTFDGLDESTQPSVPDFVKALDIDHALQPEPLLAFSMNNQPLPLQNGFPARLVVPGWYATYWVKALHRITVLTNKFEGHWMTQAYRIPDTPDGKEDAKNPARNQVPINRMNIRSFLIGPEPGSTLDAGKAAELQGIAFDGGSGVRRVEVSTDGGKSWEDATLGEDLGRFSFRRWRHRWTPPTRGEYQVRVRATSRDGQTQSSQPGWNRNGFMRNVIEEVTFRVT